MAKPFALTELEARVRALTRRGAGGGAAVVRHGPLSYDQVGRSAYINEQMLDLSARELGLLEILLARSGRLVSKEQLVDHLCEWGEEVTNNAIEVYVHRLRKKIEVGGVRIATVRGLGYCLEKATTPPNAAPTRRAAAAPRARTAHPPRPPPPRCPRATTSNRDRPVRTRRPPTAHAADLDDEPATRATPTRSRRPTPSRDEDIQHSLFGEILDWMLAPLLLLWPMSIAITYLVAKSIANEPFDHALEDSVTVLAQQVKEINGKAVAPARLGARHPARRRRRQYLFPDPRPARRLVDGDRDLPQPHEDDRRPPAPCVPHDMMHGTPVRVAYTPGELPQTPATPRRRWCRWPRRWKSAPSWPTTSSRA